MKKFLGLLMALSITVGAFLFIRLFTDTTAFQSDYKHVYIYTANPSRDAVMNTLKKDSILKHPGDFDKVAGYLDYWNSIRPGKYRIKKGASVVDIVKQLRSGIQAPARLVINKLRMPNEFARVMARAIESDSASIMNIISNTDTLKTYGLDTINWLAYIIPDTYEVFWTWTPQRILQKLTTDHEKWWDRNDRNKMAADKGLTPYQVHVIASIVEEETNKAEDKPLVASVYLNRIKRGMPLQADPTVRFAMRDFKSNRVLFSHLRTPSPYNTYLNRGLPPGPICTASPSSIEAVLNAPETDYIFFVAKADFSGYSTFTTNLSDHSKAARTYQDSLTAWLKRKAIREKAARDSIAQAAKTATQAP